METMARVKTALPMEVTVTAVPVAKMVRMYAMEVAVVVLARVA